MVHKEYEMLSLGLDIGGTKIEAVVLAEDGQTIYTTANTTPTNSYSWNSYQQSPVLLRALNKHYNSP